MNTGNGEFSSDQTGQIDPFTQLSRIKDFFESETQLKERRPDELETALRYLLSVIDKLAIKDPTDQDKATLEDLISKFDAICQEILRREKKAGRDQLSTELIEFYDEIAPRYWLDPLDSSAEPV